jgi:hypothetical protein
MEFGIKLIPETCRLLSNVRESSRIVHKRSELILLMKRVRHMRHGASNRRGRNRGSNGGGNNGGNNRRGGNNRAQVFDSNGPEVRIRGTAYQIQEKYAILAKDAAAAGDYVLSESYSQHAEHYQRIINSWGEAYDTPRHQTHYRAASDDTENLSDDMGTELPASIIGTSRAIQADVQLEDA